MARYCLINSLANRRAGEIIDTVLDVGVVQELQALGGILVELPDPIEPFAEQTRLAYARGAGDSEGVAIMLAAYAATRHPVPGGAAGGDLGGTYPNPTVVAIEGIHVENGAGPNNGDALLYDSLSNEWKHAPIVFGGGPPVGPAGGDLGGIYPNPGVTGLQLDPLPTKTPNGFLKRDAANAAWEEVAYGSGTNTVCEGNDARLSNSRTPMGAAGGDLAGTYPNPSVGALRGYAVASSTPTTNNVLYWNGTAWTPTSLDALVTNLPVICGSFSDSTSQPIPNGGSTLAVQYNTVEIAGGVTVANNLLGRPTRLTVPVDGIYAFDISPQLLNTGGGSSTITFWAKVDGVNVPRSASSLEMGNNNNRNLPFLQLDLPMLAGQYLEWYFTATGTNTSLQFFGATGTIPAIPSVIANVKRIGAIP